MVRGKDWFAFAVVGIVFVVGVFAILFTQQTLFAPVGLPDDAITGNIVAYAPPVTRADAADAIVEAFDLGITPPATPTFTDVPTTHPSYAAIETFYALGITSGCASAPARFCPDDALTRAAFAVFLTRALDLPFGIGEPLDVDDVPTTHFAAGAIQTMVNSDIMTLCEAKRFCPDNEVEAADFLSAIDAAMYDETAQYAPAVDPITDERYLYVTQSNSVDDTSFLVVGQGSGRYIYYEGYFLNASEQWQPFAFNGVRSGSWIRDSASAFITGASPEGYVLAYVCKQYGGIFRCGVSSITQPPSVRLWTLASVSEEETTAQCLDDARQLCALSQPQNSTVGVGECDSGSCFACNASTIVNRTTSMCVSPALCANTCTIDQKRCRPDFLVKVEQCQMYAGCPTWMTVADCAMSGGNSGNTCLNGVCVPSNIAQNIRVSNIVATTTGVDVIICKDAPTAVSGTLAIDMAGQGGGSPSYQAIPIQDVPLCPATSWKKSVTYEDILPTASPGQLRSVTAIISGMNSQYDASTGDNMMTRTIVVA